MSLNDHGKVEARFAAYVDELSSVIGHVRRTRQLRDYCTGFCDNVLDRLPIHALSTQMEPEISIPCRGAPIRQIGWRN